MSIVTIFNQKGGVGKTTTALNLIAALARLERFPLGIDLDPQGHLSLASGIHAVTEQQSSSAFFKGERKLSELLMMAPSGWPIIPGHMSLAKIDALLGHDPAIAQKLKTALQQTVFSNVRHIVIDCCPVLGVLTLNAVLAADYILMPVAADYLSLQGLQKVDKALSILEQSIHRPIRRKILVTRFDARRKLAFEVYDQLASQRSAQLCKTRIREAVALAESPAHAQDIFTFQPHSTGAYDYFHLTTELVQLGWFG